MFANVVIRPLAQILTYKVPETLVDKVHVGSKVIVPLKGKRTAAAFVVDLQQNTSVEYEIKELTSLAHPGRSFTEKDLEFFQWIADYYGEALSVVIDTAIPLYHAPKKEKFISLVNLTFDPTTVRSKAQKAIIETLTQNGSIEISASEFNVIVGKSASTAIRELHKKKIIHTQLKEAALLEVLAPIASWAKTEVDLSPDQTHALNQITDLVNKQKNAAALLHGVTGSGKTEVYIESIQYLLSQGKGTIVLVPEIALTPQLVDRFYARLGKHVAVLHSGLKDRERWSNWEAIQRGEKKVVIGARSALFAPMPDLGLIIIDEEHDGSFKQNEGLRYNARDLAFVKAKMTDAVIVLGSATPSLETFHRALTKQIHYLPLATRHKSASKVSIDIIDMNRLKPWELPSTHISPLLFEELQQCLQKKEQAFILYNRRGYSHYVQCEKCETSLTCPNCSVTLTFHQKQNALLCHSCSYSTLVPTFCPNCIPTPGTLPGQLSMRGAGTEKTEDELKRLFPTARIVRLDRDVAAKLSDYEAVLNAMRSHEADFLVGTQMIAKGHDLPNVTLAAVVDCDVGLHMPDFRASERVFQLLSQLAGRAGRGAKAGRVLLQTRVPKHPSIQFTSHHDFNGFAKHELTQREALHYPPFGRLLRIIISSTDEVLAQKQAHRIEALVRHFISSTDTPIQVLGPTTCAIEKLKAKWRWHLLLKAIHPLPLLKAASVIRKGIKPDGKVRVSFDIDPIDML